MKLQGFTSKEKMVPHGAAQVHRGSGGHMVRGVRSIYVALWDPIHGALSFAFEYHCQDLDGTQVISLVFSRYLTHSVSMQTVLYDMLTYPGIFILRVHPLKALKIIPFPTFAFCKHPFITRKFHN